MLERVICQRMSLPFPISLFYKGIVAHRAVAAKPRQELSLKPLGDKVLGDLGGWLLKVLRH